MGILNVTTDSFSDGALFLEPDKAIQHALEMISVGAGIIDLGAESTRPGSSPVAERDELERLIPILSKLKALHPKIIYSIDTRKAAVAKAAIQEGADIINDISALRFDPQMAAVLAEHPHVRLILMHMLGEPETMQHNPMYHDVLQEVQEFFAERIDYCVANGIKRDNLLLDPGIGFGKTLQHNLQLLANLDGLKSFGLPLVLGASRKSFIDKLCPSLPSERLEGSLAAAGLAMQQGVEILRVHDVRAHSKYLTVLTAIGQAKKSK